MPLPQNGNDIIERKAFRSQQNQIVKQQISRFAEKQIAVVVFGFDDEFNGFFSYLLRDFIDAFLKKRIGVRLGYWGVFVGSDMMLL